MWENKAMRRMKMMKLQGTWLGFLMTGKMRIPTVQGTKMVASYE